MNKDFSVTDWCCSYLLFKLNHPLVHISIWLKIRVTEKGVNNQTGSQTDQYCQQAAVNFSQRCVRGLLVITRRLVGWWIFRLPKLSQQLQIGYSWFYHSTSLPNGFLSGSCSDLQNILCRRAPLKQQWITKTVDYEWPLAGQTTLI